MTVTIRMLIQIILMTGLCGIEIFKRLIFNSKRLIIGFLKLVQRLLYNIGILWIGIINTGAILRAGIISLTIYGYRVDDGVKLIQKLLQRKHVFIIQDMYTLCKARILCTDILIAWIITRSVRISALRKADAFKGG